MMRVQSAEKKQLGVIDALSSGFEFIARRPWAVVVPIAFNLFLWLGPPINAKPLFDQAIALLNTSAAATTHMTPETQQGFEATKSALQSLGENFNALTLIALFAIGVPALLGLEPLPTSAPRPPLWVIGDIGTLFAATAAFALVGILVASIYLEIIARGIRGDASAQTFAPRVFRSYLNVALLFVITFLGAAMLLSPFIIGATLVSLINPALASFVLVIGLMLLLWVALYLAFALPAVFVSGANALQAIWTSATIFRYNFNSAMGLIFLIYLIQAGFALLWQQLVGSAWSAMAAVIANAFLGTGLIAAAMLFYNDRVNWLMEIRQRIQQQQQFKG
jgi:hypothetical protein